MSDLTPETVAAAEALIDGWISPGDASIREAFETLRECRRQQHEALERLEIGVCACAIPHAGERAVLQDALDFARTVKALMP